MNCLLCTESQNQDHGQVNVSGLGWVTHGSYRLLVPTSGVNKDLLYAVILALGSGTSEKGR